MFLNVSNPVVTRRVKRALTLRGASLAAACAVGSVAAGVSVSAAEYVVRPMFSSQLIVNDNLLLSPEGREIETILLKLAPRITVRRSTEQWQADLDVTVSAEHLEDQDFDSDNQNVSLQLARQGEKSLFQVVALNSRQTTRNVELEELGEIGFVAERRDRQYLRPSFTWSLNPTNRFAFGVSAENLHYGGFDFSDYDNYAADLAWTHQYDEKTQFQVTTFASDYSSTPPLARVDSFFACATNQDGIDQFESETLGLQFGASRQPTRRLSYRGSLGYRDVKTTTERRCLFLDGSPITIDNTAESEGFILDTGVTYQGEKYGIDASLSRSVSPVGLGFITERDSFNFSVTYRFTEEVTGSLLLNGYKTDSIDDTFLFEREGFRVAPRLTWRLTEKLSVNGGVSFRSNESLTVPGEREGTSVQFGFDYSFKPIRFSR